MDIADAQKVKGLAPLASKTDKIGAWVLAELSRRDLVPAIWLPDPAVRGEREWARFRLHLVRHWVMLKNRIHASLMSFGQPCPVSDLFGRQGRATLAAPKEGPVSASSELWSYEAESRPARCQSNPETNPSPRTVLHAVIARDTSLSSSSSAMASRRATNPPGPI